MSTYITLTGRYTDKPIHIKKSAIEMVRTAEPRKASQLSKWFGGTDLDEGTFIYFSKDRLSVNEMYTEVVKMLR